MLTVTFRLKCGKIVEIIHVCSVQGVRYYMRDIDYIPLYNCVRVSYADNCNIEVVIYQLYNLIQVGIYGGPQLEF
jgi:hypothetical protein